MNQSSTRIIECVWVNQGRDNHRSDTHNHHNETRFQVQGYAIWLGDPNGKKLKPQHMKSNYQILTLFSVFNGPHLSSCTVPYKLNELLFATQIRTIIGDLLLIIFNFLSNNKIKYSCLKNLRKMQLLLKFQMHNITFCYMKQWSFLLWTSLLNRKILSKQFSFTYLQKGRKNYL